MQQKLKELMLSTYAYGLLEVLVREFLDQALRRLLGLWQEPVSESAELMMSLRFHMILPESRAEEGEEESNSDNNFF
jgi:hypothetical protein